MRTFTLLIAVLLACSVLADQTQFESTLTNMMNMGARASDAVDSALQLLTDLKQANVDSQARADEANRSQEESLGRQIGQLTELADQNRAIGDEATTHRQWLQNEIVVTQANLVWINARREEIGRQREEFRNQRCYASFMFVKSLREHDEAIKVIRWLREDILGVISQHNGEESFIDITDSASKLRSYTYLFDEQAMKAFNQLTSKQEQVEATSAEWDTNADDNEQGGLELERMGSGSEDRDVGQRLLDAVNALEDHLVNSMAELKLNEIAAAWDLVRWLQGTEEELRILDEDQAVKERKMDNLLVAVIGAQAREDEVWEVYFESAMTLNNAIDDREAVRAWYAQEVQRRNEENGLLDEVIQMFMERVASLNGGLRSKVNDFSVDGVFNEDNDISRRTDSNLERDLGQLGANTDSEARA